MTSCDIVCKIIDFLGKCEEIELKNKIKNVGWEYDDLLYFDDKVIKERGHDVDNYLIYPNEICNNNINIFFV